MDFVYEIFMINIDSHTPHTAENIKFKHTRIQNSKHKTTDFGEPMAIEIHCVHIRAVASSELMDGKRWRNVSKTTRLVQHNGANESIATTNGNSSRAQHTQAIGITFGAHKIELTKNR